MPVRRRPARRLDMPPASLAEHGRLLCDPETPLDEEKWGRWTVPRGAPWPWPGSSYRDGAVRSLMEEGGLACPALGLDPDPEVSRRAAVLLAERAERTAGWFLHAHLGIGTGIPTVPAGLEAYRAEQAGPYLREAEFWREHLAEIDRRLSILRKGQVP